MRAECAWFVCSALWCDTAVSASPAALLHVARCGLWPAGQTGVTSSHEVCVLASASGRGVPGAPVLLTMCTYTLSCRCAHSISRGPSVSPMYGAAPDVAGRWQDQMRGAEIFGTDSRQTS